MPRLSPEMTDEQVQLLEQVFSDACNYRQSDDKDEDGDADNNQVADYMRLAKTFGITVYY